MLSNRIPKGQKAVSQTESAEISASFYTAPLRIIMTEMKQPYSIHSAFMKDYTKYGGVLLWGLVVDTNKCIGVDLPYLLESK